MNWEEIQDAIVALCIDGICIDYQPLRETKPYAAKKSVWCVDDGSHTGFGDTLPSAVLQYIQRKARNP